MISIYLRNRNINPSCYYRIVQYLPYCDEEYKVHSLTPDGLYDISINSEFRVFRMLAKAVLYMQICIKTFFSVCWDMKHADIIVVQRETVPRYIPMILRPLIKKLYNTKKLIWDVDDDLWVRHEISSFESELLLSCSQKITVSADSVESLLRKINPQAGHGSISVIPTTDGLFNQQYPGSAVEKRISRMDKEIRLLWLGTSGNIAEVTRIVPRLEAACNKTGKKTVLTIVSGKKPVLASDVIGIRFIKWSRETAANELMNNHIGIMPLQNTVFNRSKGGFKLIQYMAHALPVIGDCVGTNEKLINDSNGVLVADESEWSDAIVSMSENAERYRNLSMGSYKMWNERFSFQDMCRTTMHVWQSLTDK